MHDKLDGNRRDFLTVMAATGSAFLLNACENRRSGQQSSAQGESAGVQAKKEKIEGSKEVTASEDLMREHGVLRRALFVYSEVAVKLRRDPKSVFPAVLEDTAKLFRDFGENYHEKKLEEAFIFPTVKAAGGPAAAYPDVLVVQHNRGREITNFIISIAQSMKSGASAKTLAEVLEGFVRMYRTHAAREDTLVFPAWKNALTDAQYDELNDRFEEIERQQFGQDGFEAAVKKIGDIEDILGLRDIAQFTAPAPPG
jgi:hemerythrin-like domain-containing protein